MTDVGRRDAMSISSLLSEPPQEPSPASTESRPNVNGSASGAVLEPAHNGNGQAYDESPQGDSILTSSSQEDLDDDTVLPQEVQSVLDSVALPADTGAANAARALAARFSQLATPPAVQQSRLTKSLSAMARRSRDEADMFVAYAYPSLLQRTETRSRSAQASSGSSRGGAAGESGGKSHIVVLTHEPRKGRGGRKARKKDAGAPGEFVPIAPAQGPSGSGSGTGASTGKRKRHNGEEPAPKRRTAARSAAATASAGKDESAPTTKKAVAAAQRREKQYTNTYEGIWRDIARRDVPKAHKFYVIGNSVKLSNCRKTATLAAKEARKWQLKTNRHVKDLQTRARRAMREMLSYWKRNEKEERDSRKKAEKVALDSARKQEEEREALRQSRKLNFLITQTELYSHFVGSKTKSGADGEEDAASQPPTKASNLDFDAEDDSAIQAAAAANAQAAVARARSRASEFDGPKAEDNDDGTGAAGDDDFQNPAGLGDAIVTQPKLLSCQLKEYQLKGLTWLANLYEQGINGILADEMGLGKTVQSISVMAYLAEVHDIWGPFLVVAPASTLHNWQQEITKFVPEFKVLPYWGSNKDRKVLRKFWDRKQLRYTRDSPFHVLVTSYQLVVADAQYFNRIKWQYMILDEAQAIKSSSSSRWKSLLGMQCRNRLLLTGTPIQNSMHELWALLHFIMPTLFDSHEEFSDWFSKDIESHATKNKELNEAQLKRLHMILKPFMLRRVKKHVQQELGDKIEIDVYCNLTPRQRVLYRLVKSQISIRDLIEKGASGDDAASLMNLVMQFRKVCNHPDLFERQDVLSAFSFASFGQTSDWLRETDLSMAATARNPVELSLPKLFVEESGVLDFPGNFSDEAAREKLLRKLGVVFDVENEYVKDIERFSNTPAGDIVRTARQGLLERALNNAPALVHVQESPIGDVSEKYMLDNYIKVFEPAYHDRVTAPPVTLFASNRSFYLKHASNLAAPRPLFPLTLDEEWRRYLRNELLIPPILPDNGKAGFNTVSVPSMPKFIADSGKLKKLDEMLVQLKREDHRVLIYFQMTRMMDLMEEYLTFRQYKYVRLDGSSKLGDRRDLVNDWQTRPELFVFLLSTRAGGLGINLTAADTVIFFDSDWNPTIDSQAMDRAHRLGQTRQVTVYRLLVRGTIEERMRNRAKQKEQVQAVVMEGSKAGQEVAKKSTTPQGKDVAYWLLDDDEDDAPKIAEAP